MKTKTKDFETRFFESIVQERPNYVDALTPLAEAYTRNGHYEEGLAIDSRLAELCADDSVVHYNLACSLALVGKKQEALRTLKKSVALGYRDFAHMRKDKDLECLQPFGEFKKLCATPLNKA